jgi:hypothetical protein
VKIRSGASTPQGRRFSLRIRPSGARPEFLARFEIVASGNARAAVLVRFRRARKRVRE